MTKQDGAGRFLKWTGVVTGWALCLLTIGAFVTGCSDDKHRFYHTIEADIEPDEHIGVLAVCWPDTWTDAEKAAGREAVSTILTHWEVYFKTTSVPGKLLVSLKDEDEDWEWGDLQLIDRSIILVLPGECYDFPSLFNLLCHLNFGDPKEIDPRWSQWNAIGEALSANLATRCPLDDDGDDDGSDDDDGSGDDGDDSGGDDGSDDGGDDSGDDDGGDDDSDDDSGDDDSDDDDGDDDGDGDDPDLTDLQKDLRKLLRKCFRNHCPRKYRWLRARYGPKAWHLHWWKHWRPSKQCRKALREFAENYQLLDHPGWRWLKWYRH